MILTYEGKTVGKIDAVPQAEPAWRDQTPEERLKIIRDIVARAPRKRDDLPDAAHSQDFLYDENGLPA